MTIALIEQQDAEFISLETHCFYRDTDESDGLWVWHRRHAGEPETVLEEQGTTLRGVLGRFLERTSLGDQIAMTLETSNDVGDATSSVCVGDVLKIIAPACLDTRIELIAIDGKSFGVPRLIRNGPIPDTPAISIATFAQGDIDGPITILFSNVAMTDWHDDLNQWHLWEVLYKSGDNYILFQSEIEHDDQVFVFRSAKGVPRELLDLVSSASFPTEGTDLHPTDKWGRLEILDEGREFLP